MGINKYLFSPTVDINYGYISDDYGVFSIGLEGAEWAIGLTDNFTFSSRIGYDAGRDEKIGILGNKNERSQRDGRFRWFNDRRSHSQLLNQ